MCAVLEADCVTLVGADTASASWQSMERFLHGALAQLFHMVVGRPDMPKAWPLTRVCAHSLLSCT